MAPSYSNGTNPTSDGYRILEARQPVRHISVRIVPEMLKGYCTVNLPLSNGTTIHLLSCEAWKVLRIIIDAACKWDMVDKRSSSTRPVRNMGLIKSISVRSFTEMLWRQGDRSYGNLGGVTVQDMQPSPCLSMRAHDTVCRTIPRSQNIVQHDLEVSNSSTFIAVRKAVL